MLETKLAATRSVAIGEAKLIGKDGLSKCFDFSAVPKGAEKVSAASERTEGGREERFGF